MNSRRRTFLDFSAELTGYSATDLEGTGLVDQYQSLVEKQVGKTIAKQFYTLASLALRQRTPAARAEVMRIDVLPSPTVWPLCSALIVLWYTGAWKTPPATWYAGAGSAPPKGVTPGQTIVPSAQAYTEQLAFRAAGAHPPGANPTGHGSWSIPPVFGDFVHRSTFGDRN